MESKTFSYIDNESKRYISYQCTLKKEISEEEIDEFSKKLYGMKLDTYLSNKKVFKEGFSTKNLIQEFKNIFKSEIINFNNIINLFNSEEILSTDIVKIPLSTFFKMFNFNAKNDFSTHELNGIIRATTMGNFQKTETYKKTKEEMKSINPNTKLMKKTGYIFNSERNKVLVR